MWSYYAFFLHTIACNLLWSYILWLLNLKLLTSAIDFSLWVMFLIKKIILCTRAEEHFKSKFCDKLRADSTKQDILNFFFGTDMYEYRLL